MIIKVKREKKEKIMKKKKNSSNVASKIRDAMPNITYSVPELQVDQLSIDFKFANLNFMWCDDPTWHMEFCL